MSRSLRVRLVSRAVFVVAALLLAGGLWWSVVDRPGRSAHPPALAIEEALRSADTTSGAVTDRDADAARVVRGFPPAFDALGTLRHPGGRPETRAVVAVFLAPECPISNGVLPELNRLHDRFAAHDVEFFGIVCDRHAGRDAVAEHAERFGIRFPVLLDAPGAYRRLLRATHTPQAVVVDADGHIAYSGRIDDRYKALGRPRPTAERHDLEEALAAVIVGERPAVARTAPVGCLLEPDERAAGSDDVTFCRDVAPVIFARCTTCHRTGEAVPFALETYEDVRRRAEQVAHVVQKRIMPPWLAHADSPRFLNEHRLEESEIELLVRWTANGAPLGDVAHLPPAPQFAPGWQLGEPDLVLEMPEGFDVPADGPDIYRHFVLPTGAIGDRLVSAFEFRPGAPQVVHHAWLYFDTRGAARSLDAADPGPGYSRFGGPGFVPNGGLGGWGPGGRPRRLPEGMGRPLPAGADLVLQVHYHPTGKAERDRSRVGLHFAPIEANRTVLEIMVGDVDLEIPAGAARHRFDAAYVVPADLVLFDVSPHMHLLGKEVRVSAVTPRGDVLPLVRIDDWNFYWQEHYVFAKPVRLPAGTRIELTAWFDNSAANPHNPHDPPRTVRFGEGSGDEMAVCYFQATTERREDLPVLADHASRYFAEMLERYRRDQEARRAAESSADDATSAEDALRSDAEAAGGEELSRFTGRTGIEFVRIPAGSFRMGTDAPERIGPQARCESPARRVSIERPLGFARHETTVGQFRRFVKETGYVTEAERDGRGANGLDAGTGRVTQDATRIWSRPGFAQTERHPVTCVSPADAEAFCRWVATVEERACRLPTEAEWEYACRAGTDTLFWCGDGPDDLEGAGNGADARLRRVLGSAEGAAAWDDGFAFTAPVGSFRPNPWGLFDVHGNVGEWCANDFVPVAESPSSSASAPRTWRAVRGGSWYNTPASCRSSGRHDGVPTARSTTNGFRVVLGEGRGSSTDDRGSRGRGRFTPADRDFSASSRRAPAAGAATGGARRSAYSATTFTAGGIQVPSMMDGDFSRGQ